MLTIRKIRVPSGDARAARRAADYALGSRESPRAIERAAGGDRRAADRAPTAVWLGSAVMLGQLEVAPGEALTRQALSRALQGRAAASGERVRTEGMIQRDASDERGRPVYDAAGRHLQVRVRGTKSVDLTFSAPKSVSVAWSQASHGLKAEIEAAMLAAAEAVVGHMTLTKPVVSRRCSLSPARGYAAAAALHVVARAARARAVASPQLHVHCLLVGVERFDGYFASPELLEMFRNGAPLEGGAVGRARLAECLVDLGFEIEQAGRFFEIAGVPRELLALMSARAQEVEARIRERERRGGGRLSNRERAAIALETRQPKGTEASLARTIEAWREEAGRFGFDAAAVEALRRGGHGFSAPLRRRRERGSGGPATVLLECAAGRLRLAEALGGAAAAVAA